MQFADVILPLTLPQTLTYGVPQELQGTLQRGMRVEVSLGRNKQYAAIVERIHDERPEAYQVKPIRSILDDLPIVDDTQLEFWKWIAHYYMAAPGEVMQAALPAHLKLAGETRLVWIFDQSRVIEWGDEAFLAAEALEMRKELTISELKNIVGARHVSTVLQELLEQEAVQIEDGLETTYKPRKEKIVVLNAGYKEDAAMQALFDELKKAPKQLELVMAYVELSMKQPFVQQNELLERSRASSAQVSALVDKGVFTVQEKDVDRLIYESSGEIKQLELSAAQQAAFEEMEKGLAEKDVVLLEGVTGSGKTLLYIHKIKQCLEAGRQAVLLLPEIGLTTQLVSRLYAYFGEELGVYHSRFSNNERVEIWEKVRKRQYKVIAGPRSALWLPYRDPGLFIVDEEHDGSFKQRDPAPRFHARDAAVYLAGLHQAKVILGSATPSVESLYNVSQGKYAYAALRERYQGVSMPSIRFVNARSLESVRSQGLKMLTPELQKAMEETLAARKQVILFQNRRGYSPFQLCTVCGWVPQCKNCAVSLTYHKSTDKLHCHYCGLKTAVIHTCPSCGSNRLSAKSFGTEKIEEEVQQVFPKARIARMDVDSMRGKNSLPALMELVARQKIDVLVGTQMVVKGLDFAHVALVGVLSADTLLSYPDFRVNERAFQLMEQVSGRAGRTDGAGEVLIQAFNLEHPVLSWVKDHDIRAFYRHEIKYREFFAYPPFTRLIRVIFRHKDDPKAAAGAALMAETLRETDMVTIQGPVPALIARVRNQYIHEIWIKCPRDIRVLDQVKALLLKRREEIVTLRGNSGLQIVFDVDPV